MQIVRSQLNLSANVSYNSRRDIGGYLSRKLNVSLSIKVKYNKALNELNIKITVSGRSTTPFKWT